MKIVLTGATGFLGKIVSKDLSDNQFQIIPLSLRNRTWKSESFDNITSLIHMAGIAHNNSKNESDYFSINRDLTIKLAQKAKKEKVEHFIFISTIKVNGEGQNEIINERSPYKPSNIYARSKMEAELALLKMRSDEFNVSILRPPLIYGTFLKGNLLNLMKLCHRFPVIPFGGILNKRAMVAGSNVSQLISILIKTKKEGIFIPTDDMFYSTTYIVNKFCELNNSKPFIFSIGPFRHILKFINAPLYFRLFGDFIVDATQTKEILQWQPGHNFETFLNSIKSTERNDL